MTFLSPYALASSLGGKAGSVSGPEIGHVTRYEPMEDREEKNRTTAPRLRSHPRASSEVHEGWEASRSANRRTLPGEAERGCQKPIDSVRPSPDGSMSSPKLRTFAKLYQPKSDPGVQTGDLR